MDKPAKSRRSRALPNPLREYLERVPAPMSKVSFAKAIGVSPSYLSMLIADDAPWPTREVQLRIAEVTNGKVDPNKLAGWLRHADQ